MENNGLTIETITRQKHTSRTAPRPPLLVSISDRQLDAVNFWHEVIDINTIYVGRRARHLILERASCRATHTELVYAMLDVVQPAKDTELPVNDGGGEQQDRLDRHWSPPECLSLPRRLAAGATRDWLFVATALAVRGSLGVGMPAEKEIIGVSGRRALVGMDGATACDALESNFGGEGSLGLCTLLSSCFHRLSCLSFFLHRFARRTAFIDALFSPFVRRPH